MPRCPTCHRRLGDGALCPADGDRAAAGPPRPAEVAPSLDGYTISSCIGRGGTSTVWAAVRQLDGAAVALKVADNASEYTARRFRREAEVLAQTEGGAAPRLVDAGALPTRQPFVAIEWLAGVTLGRYLESREAPPSCDDAIAIAVSIAANLRAVHDAGHSHYDLKPSNIFLVAPPPAPETRLIDFGLSSPEEGERHGSTIGVVAGSLEYMAPERLAGARDADRRADIYGFGIVLFELLTLRVPFAGDRAFIERGHTALRPPRPSSITPMPAGLERLVLDCLAKEPTKRPTLPEIATRLSGSIGAPLAWSRAESSPGAATIERRTSREPVVILVAEIATVEAISDVRRRGGIVARQSGTRHVCVFSGIVSDDPGHAALSCGEALAERGVPSALHLADLVVRSSSDDVGPRFYGPAIDAPDEWLPRALNGGVLVSSALASSLSINYMPAAAAPGFGRVTRAKEDSNPATVLVGRGAEHALAARAIESCFRARSPSLVSIIGETGVGKSRFASDLVALGEAMPGVRALIYRARKGADHQRGLLACIGAEELAGIPDRDAARDIGALLIAAARLQPTALVIDDAHRLGDVLCDALEYATLDTDSTPLFVAVAAHPRFEARRRDWGRGAHRYHRIALEPLDEEAAMELAAGLLLPAEYPPAAVLRQLAQWSGGNPFFLVEIVRALKAQGLVRERSETGSHYLATADFERLPAIPANQWLANRALEAVPSEVAALARLLAVLGAEFSRDEVAFVQDAADRAGLAASAVDTDVGLEELERSGIIIRVRREWAFTHSALVDAFARTLAEADVAILRGAAMEFWRERAERNDEVALGRYAGHAAATNHAATARAAYLSLGERARSEHRSVDADQHYSTAIDFAGDDRWFRARALAGRGAVRYRMQRVAEAIDDLREAARLASDLDEPKSLANWLLAEATALDWADRYADSAARVEEARHIATTLGDPELEARCVVALGRTRWRQERIDEAIALLSRGAELTDETGDYEYRVIALVLLPLALIFADRRDEARLRFDQVIKLCEEAGDRFHLCVAYGNRMFLWRSAPHLAVADLRRANQLAREVGQAVAERATTHNLAEILFWGGDDTESLALAERAFSLQRRLLPRPVADDALLLGRIHAGRNEWHRVRERLRWIADHVDQDSLAPSDLIVIEMLGLSITCAEQSLSHAEGWDPLIARARSVLAAEEFLEVLYTRARLAANAGDNVAYLSATVEAASKLQSCAVWQRRFAALLAKSVASRAD